MFLRVAVMDQRSAVLADSLAEKPFYGSLPQRRSFVQVADDLSAQKPQVVHVFANGLRGKVGCGEMLKEWPKASHQFFTRR